MNSGDMALQVLKSIGSLIQDNWAMICWVCGAGVGAIEIIPGFKAKPITWILKKLGSCVNRELSEKIDKVVAKQDALEEKMNTMEEQSIKQDIEEMRWNILDFANSCRNGRRHSKEEFDHVIREYTRYEKTIESRNMENGQIELDYQFISEIYLKCQRENNFLGSEEKASKKADTKNEKTS